MDGDVCDVLELELPGEDLPQDPLGVTGRVLRDCEGDAVFAARLGNKDNVNTLILESSKEPLRCEKDTYIVRMRRQAFDPLLFPSFTRPFLTLLTPLTPTIPLPSKFTTAMLSIDANPQTHLSLSLWVRLEVKILLPRKEGLKVLRM